MVLAADPLFDAGVDGRVLVVVLLKVGVAFALLLVAVMLMIWFERKLIGDMQNRIGPARGGSSRHWPTGSSCSSRRTCCPTRPTGRSSA